jgi:amidase
MNSTPSQKSTNKDNHQISRRSFIGTTAAGGAALLTGGLASLFEDSASARTNFPFVEMSITQLQAAMAAGQLSAKDLVQGYLNRIQQLGPTLNAVIETNTNAIATANSLDRERKASHVRGPLHGIPLLVKDNIATNDNMQTTAGSLALYNSKVPADAPLIARLRAAGRSFSASRNLGSGLTSREHRRLSAGVGWSARGHKERYD